MLFVALIFSPFLFGVINRTKAVFAGRQGPPLLQMYFDLFKLAKKSVVYSKTTSPVFKMGSVVVFVTIVTALVFVPLPGALSLFSFQADLVFILYLLALGRFFLVISALDTGSSFEGMGASREVCFSLLAEVALFFALITLALNTHSFSLKTMLTGLTPQATIHSTPAMVLIMVVLFLLLLIENARIPVDDPNTHLELTMIHEVMILDHSGPDLAIMLYASCLKLCFFAALIVDPLVSLITTNKWLLAGFSFVGLFVIAVAVGIVESTLARLRLIHVPRLIVSAATLAALGLLMSTF